MKNPQINVSKAIFLAVFIAAISLFSLGFILDIVNLLLLAESYYFGEYWYLYVSLFVDILLCIAFIVGSATVLLWRPDSKGNALFLSAGLYVVLSGLVLMVTGLTNAIVINEVSPAITATISIFQISLGIMCIVLRKRRPNASRVIGSVSFVVFAINNLSNAITDIILRSYIPAVFQFIAIIFDILAIVAFCSMKVEAIESAAKGSIEAPNQTQD